MNFDISNLPPVVQEAILNGPALKPPDGVLPNLVDPPNGNQIVTIIAIICLVSATLSFLLRTALQVFIMKKLRIPDFLLLTGYGLFVGYIYCVFRIMRGTGFHVHEWNVPVKNIAEFAYVMYVGSNCYKGTILSIKSAILLEWLHIFVPTGCQRNGFFWSCVALLAINGVFYVLGIIINQFECIPYTGIWIKTIAAKCINKKALDVSDSVINLVLDVAILILPHRIIWNLRLSTAKKIGISVLFVFGVFACVAASFRIAVTVAYSHSLDVTYTSTPVAMWAMGEMTAGFLVLCIPNCPKVMKELGLGSKLGSRLTSSLKSWIRIPTNKEPGKNTSFPHNSTSLGRSEAKGSTPSQSTKGLIDIEMGGSIIVQTVVTTTKSSTNDRHLVSAHAHDSNFYLHHPWAADGRVDDHV